MRELFLCRWVDAPLLPQMNEMERVARAYEAQQPTGCSLANVVVDGTPVFSNEVRRRSTELTGDPTLFDGFRAHVVLLGGLRSLAVRSFINTFLLLGKPPRPSRALSSIPEAVDWMLPQLQTGWSREELVATLEYVRDAAGPDAEIQPAPGAGAS